jgi:hypothetical protein
MTWPLIQGVHAILCGTVVVSVISFFVCAVFQIDLLFCTSTPQISQETLPK